jgi:glyoxylase I family protein
MLNTAYEKQDQPQVPDPLRIASHADTSIYFGCPDVEDAYNQIRAKDLKWKHRQSRNTDLKH